MPKKKSLSIKVAKLLIALSVMIATTPVSAWWLVGEPELPKNLRVK